MLSQAVLPVNMALAWRFLGTRFRPSHYVGAALAVGAGFVQVLCSDKAAGTAQGGDYALFVLIMLLSVLPAAGGNVYKERCLKVFAHWDLWYVNAVVATLQLTMGLLSVPLISLPFTAGHVPLSRLRNYFHDATRCTLGDAGGVMEDLPCASDVAPPWEIFCIYIVFNLLFSNLMLLLFRKGSSTLFSIGSTARIPVVALMLLFPALAGPKASTPHASDAFAAALAVAGLACYQMRPERRRGGAEAQSAEEAEEALLEELEEEGGLQLPLLSKAEMASAEGAAYAA